MRRGSAWGSVRGLPAQSRQLPLTSHQPISVQCQEDRMVVTVPLDLFGNGRLVPASGLFLGSQRCVPTSQDQQAAVFQYHLQECGNQLQTSAAFLIYSTVLSYNPTAASSSAVITRTNAASVPIRCFYPRHGNVSSNPIKPTWMPFSTTLTSEERLSFHLSLMKEDWSGLRSGYDFVIGEPMYIQASVDVLNHIPMRILVDRCVAQLSPDINSDPSYALIDYYGCLSDSKEVDSGAAFVTPRAQQNVLRFTINAFRFTDHDQSAIYIYCNLRAVSSDQTADATNKACYYTPTNTWAAVEGSAGICSCCASNDCGHSRRLGSRRHWKRHQEAELEQEVHTVALGPLYIMDPARSSNVAEAQAAHGSPEQGVKPWMVVAVGGLWVLVVVGALLTWRRRVGKPHVIHEQK
ncbi:zona pellucida sperm-binding protein 3-like [Gastrophryne carolinensis]